MPKTKRKKIEIAVLRGSSHVLAFDVHMYVGIGSVYDYECASASKEAYMYVSTWISGSEVTSYSAIMYMACTYMICVYSVVIHVVKNTLKSAQK